MHLTSVWGWLSKCLKRIEIWDAYGDRAGMGKEKIRQNLGMGFPVKAI